MRRDTHKQAEPKATYRVKNWAQYNAGLIARGDVTMWIDEGMCKASAAQARKRGHLHIAELEQRIGAPLLLRRRGLGFYAGTPENSVVPHCEHPSAHSSR